MVSPTRSLAKVKVYWNKFLLYCTGTRTLAQAFWSIVDIPNLAIMSSMAVAWVFDISACTLWPHIDGLRLHIDGPEESSERKGTTCYCGLFVCHFNCVAPTESFKDHGFLQSICQTTWLHPNCFESILAITGSRSPTLDPFDAVKDISELARPKQFGQTVGILQLRQVSVTSIPALANDNHVRIPYCGRSLGRMPLAMAAAVSVHVCSMRMSPIPHPDLACGLPAVVCQTWSKMDQKWWDVQIRRRKSIPIPKCGPATWIGRRALASCTVASIGHGNGTLKGVKVEALKGNSNVEQFQQYGVADGWKTLSAAPRPGFSMFHSVSRGCKASLRLQRRHGSTSRRVQISVHSVLRLKVHLTWWGLSDIINMWNIVKLLNESNLSLMISWYILVFENSNIARIASRSVLFVQRIDGNHHHLQLCQHHFVTALPLLATINSMNSA